MTSRELADRINDLSVVNIELHEKRKHGVEVLAHLSEKRELIIRDIDDGLLRLDHNPGVALHENAYRKV